MSTVTENTLSFHQALTMAEAQALATLPADLRERLSAAVALTKAGAVLQLDDGTWEVASASEPGRTYSPNSHCSCDDHFYNHPQFCKHQLSVFLSRRALQLMAQPPAPVVPETVELEPWPDNDFEEESPMSQPPAGPTPPPLPEAAFSLTLKGTYQGHPGTLLTVRGMTAAEFHANLKAVEGLLEAPQPQPAPQAARAREAGPAQEPGWCKIHKCEMTLNTKDGRSWFSHKTQDGWCKGK